MDIFLGHNEDNFLKFWPELSLTYAVNFSREDLLSKKLLTCVQCVSRLRPKNLFYLSIYL